MRQVPGESAEGGRRATGHYITGQESPVQQQSLCRGGERMEDKVGGSSGRIWVHCVVHTTSPEGPRGAAGMRKLRPGTSREQKPSRSDPELQPPPSSRDGPVITIAGHRHSVEQDNYDS